jgi:hypothetical protein
VDECLFLGPAVEDHFLPVDAEWLKAKREQLSVVSYEGCHASS